MSHALIDQALASFFDIEAIVDEEDEDEEMGDEASQELSDFLSHEVSEGEEDEEDEDDGVALHDDDSDDEFDAEEVVRQIEIRHNAQLDKEREQGRAASNEAEGVDPVVFYVTVARNSEEEAVKCIDEYASHRREHNKPTWITRAERSDKIPGRVFVWGTSINEVINLARTFSFMDHRRIAVVEQEEWLQTHSLLERKSSLQLPAWVRIRAGLYKGDLALAEQLLSSGKLELLVVPRFAQQEHTKPPASLLCRENAVKIWGPRPVRDHPTESRWFKVKRMIIKGGLLSYTISVSRTVVTLPKSLAEITPFVEAASLGGLATQSFIFRTADEIKNQDLSSTFFPHDRVIAGAGPFNTMSGRIREISDDDTAIVEFQSADQEDLDPTIPRGSSVSLRDLRRVFKVGDDIRVCKGKETGRRGLVVQVAGNVLTFSDMDVTGGEEVRDWLNKGHATPAEVAVYSCNVEFCDPETKWRPQQREDDQDQRDLPTTVGQRVEIIGGPLHGSRGYTQSWNPEGFIVKLYFKPSLDRPTFGKHAFNPFAGLDTLSVPASYLRRCFVAGDVVFKRDLPNTKFIVYEDELSQGGTLMQPIENSVYLVNTQYDRHQHAWVPVPTPKVFSLERRDLIFQDTAHDPQLSWNIGFCRLHKGSPVVVIKGPYKGYVGLVKNVLRNEAEVDLEAIQKVVKVKHNHLDKRQEPPTVVRPFSQPVQLVPQSDLDRASTPPPTVENSLPTAWDPSSEVPGSSQSPDVESLALGSPWLLTPTFQHALDTVPMQFTVRGSKPDFAGGKYEGHMVSTIPLSKRGNITAGPGEVVVYLNFFTKGAIPVKYLVPRPADPGVSGVILRGVDAGLAVDIDELRSTPMQFMAQSREAPKRWVVVGYDNVVRLDRARLRQM